MSKTKKASPSLAKALAILLFVLGPLALLGTLISWSTGSIDLPQLLGSLVAIALVFYLAASLIYSARTHSRKTPARKTQSIARSTAD